MTRKEEVDPALQEAVNKLAGEIIERFGELESAEEMVMAIEQTDLNASFMKICGQFGLAGINLTAMLKKAINKNPQYLERSGQTKETEIDSWRLAMSLKEGVGSRNINDLSRALDTMPQQDVKELERILEDLFLKEMDIRSEEAE